MQTEFETGIFIKECSNRFLCIVKIRNIEETCYMSSSSKLSHFIQLAGRQVLLIPNKGKEVKTKYTLFAVKNDIDYTLLNLCYVNKLLLNEFSKQDSIYEKPGKILREKKVEQLLKVDFLIESSQKIIVEAKGILTENTTAYFPSVVKVDRAIHQLIKLKLLLEKGYHVHYYIVLMNKEIRYLVLNKEYSAFFQAFTECLQKGMRIFVFKTIWDKQNFSLVRDLSIEKFLICN